MNKTGNIYLCGFMASGKSTVGRLLAAVLGWPFVDMDTLVEAKTGRSIAELFATEGEFFFRQLESEALTEIAIRKGHVVACGGGLVQREENRTLMEKTGISIGLLVTAKTVLERVRDGTERPLLNVPNRLERVMELLSRRGPMYEALDVTVATDGLSPQQVRDALLVALRKEGVVSRG